MSIILRKIDQAKEMIHGEAWIQKLRDQLRFKHAYGLLIGYDQRLTPGFKDSKSVEWQDASLHFEFNQGSFEDELFLKMRSKKLAAMVILSCVVQKRTPESIVDALNHFLDILEDETKEFESFKKSFGEDFFRQTNFSEFEFRCGNTYARLGRVSSFDFSTVNSWRGEISTSSSYSTIINVENVLGVENAFYAILKDMNMNDFLLLPQTLRDNIANECFQGQID